MHVVWACNTFTDASAFNFLTSKSSSDLSLKKPLLNACLNACREVKPVCDSSLKQIRRS